MNTEIICIIDRSRSMLSLRHDVVDGFNHFLNEQKALPGEARVTLVLFNGAMLVPFAAKLLTDCPKLTQEQYAPIGSTALFDAIGFTLEQHGKRIATEGWAQQVVVNIITDGYENASTTYSLDQVRAMIEHAQEMGGWLFLFQAANQDAFEAGTTYGISGATTANFTASSAGMQQAYGNTSATVATMRATGSVQAAADVFSAAPTL